MRPIKESTYNAIKSRNLTGSNRFNHKITIEGEPIGWSSIIGSKTNTVMNANYGRNFQFCETVDGKIFAMSNTGRSVRASVITRDALEGTPDILSTQPEVFVYSNENMEALAPYSILRLRSGKILILMCEYAFNLGRLRVLLFKSENGTGKDIDWSSRVPIYEYNNGSPMMSGYHAIYGLRGFEADDGTIYMISAGNAYNYSGYLAASARCYKSFDGGNTWFSYQVGGQNLRLEFTAGLIYLKSQNILAFSSNAYSLGSWPVAIFYSLDKGLTWYSRNTSGFDPAFTVSGQYVYALSKNGNLYRMELDMVTVDRLASVADWELYRANAITASESYIGSGYANWDLYAMTDGTIILRSTPWQALITSLYRKFIDSKFKAQSISISKSHGGASTATIQVDNKNGAVNPRNQDGPLYKILGLNKQIVIEQGYGDDMVPSFTGIVDSIDMSTWPQVATISLRDNFKKALDQTITKAGNNVVLYPNQPIENIVTDLCNLCGLTIGYIEPTGITIEKEFSWQSYADAFQFLSDIASFEYLCDETGKFHFRRDFQPGNMQVAWSFEEGVDIADMSYKLDDNDIYNSVRVYGQSGEDTIVYTAPFLDAAQFNILPQKFLKINATEASTVNELKKIAERAISTMRSRTRVINFTAIAVPHLQSGDFIQIFESSTDTHEIYRLTSIGLEMDNKKFIMRCTAYYYGDSIVPSELPDTTGTQSIDPNLNLIPEMTSNTTPSGVARASSVYKDWQATYSPWRSLNGNDQDFFWDANTKVAWLEYEFPQKMIVDKYVLRARELILYNKAMPKDFTFEAFNGEKWIVLDTRTNQVDWQIYEERAFKFTNTTAYAKYRINITRNNGYTRTQFERLKMYYGGGA